MEGIAPGRYKIASKNGACNDSEGKLLTCWIGHFNFLGNPFAEKLSIYIMPGAVHWSPLCYMRSSQIRRIQMKRKNVLAIPSQLLSTRYVVFFLLFLGNLSFASASETKEFREKVELNSGGKLTIEAHKGSIRVKTWDKNLVDIVAIIEAPDDVSPSYATRSVEATEIEVVGRGSSVSIRSNYDDVPSRDSWFGGHSKTLPYVHYTITAPKKLRLRIDDHKSKIELSNIDGRIDVETHKGSLEAHNLSGKIYLDTHKGDFHLSGVDGSIEANTHKGEIQLEKVQITDDCKFETHKGTIALQLPASAAFELVADVGRKGRLRSDFDLPRSRWHDEDEHIRAAVNGGGPEIYFRTHKGMLRLNN